MFQILRSHWGPRVMVPSPAFEVCVKCEDPKKVLLPSKAHRTVCMGPGGIPPQLPCVNPPLDRQLLFRLLKRYLEGDLGLLSNRSPLPQQPV